MTLRVEQHADEAIAVAWASQPLFRYVYRPQTPRSESPKPYLHPVTTLAGDVVTDFRPDDHPWHTGISMTSAHLSGENFWGGGTYVRDQGYADLPNHGTIEHVSWEAIESDETTARFVERLTWRTFNGQSWIDERRAFGVAAVDPAAGWYRLFFDFRLRNTAGHELEFSSPAIEGREGAGYGGLFWRGPMSFLGGNVAAAGGLAGPGVMGQQATWLSFTRPDGASSPMLLFIDRDGPRSPTPWFVRNDPIPVVSFAFAFSERLMLAAGDELVLGHDIVVAARELSPDEIEHLAPAPS